MNTDFSVWVKSHAPVNHKGFPEKNKQNRNRTIYLFNSTWSYKCKCH